MYVPVFNALTDEQVDALLASTPAAQLITTGPDGSPDATLLPVLVERYEHDPERVRVRAHFARANEHWRRITTGSPALVVVSAADAYVSPGWYASKAEHGRVVPTWNYSAVHLRGQVTVHDDVEWVRTLVTDLTTLHESHRDHPWAVTDAPARYVEGQLRAVVGVEVLVDSVVGKGKLSQNRSDADRLGVIEGLERDGTPQGRQVAEAMRAVPSRHS